MGGSETRWDPGQYLRFSDHRLRPALELLERVLAQEFKGEDPILEWVRGTGLRPVLHALDGDERQVFLDAYRRRCVKEEL
jgi:trans-aconitate methyltransferase